jgi:GAF domain-containing protein/ActR/RegA family two-component response regulator
MHHILILDDNENFAKQLERIVGGFDRSEESFVELAFTPDQALTLAKLSNQSGNPHTVFLVDQRLGAGMDGIATMKELLAISPGSDAVIFTGFDNSEDGVRAYDAGASRYLSKTAEPRELIFVLNDLARSRREKVENKWRVIFSEMMETALHHNKFTDVAKVVVDYSIQLGFKRAHLFWAPKQSEIIQRNTFVGIECAGDGCIPSFSEMKFFLPYKKIIGRLLHSRDAVFVNETDVNMDLKDELESIGFQFPAGGWWILPLWGGQELLGALTLDFGETQRHLSMHERTLLDFFSRQVSVTLEHAGLYSREKRTSEEMKLLQRASVEMLRIANKSEDDFWLTILTIATANFGLGFNRALLLLTKDNHRILYGRAGIGDNDTEDTRRGWERDEERNYGFDSFLEDVSAKRIQLTSLHKFISGKEMLVQEFGKPIRDILEIGEMVILSEEEASVQLPETIKCGFTPFACALIPIRAGNNILGFVIVDNKHNHKPLSRNSLENLQTLLANAGLVWETLRQRAQSEELLDANYEILGGASHQPLKETLGRICKTARVISQADWAIIYPFKYGVTPHEIEIENFGYDGELKSSIMDVTTDKIRVGGVSTHVIQKKELVVKNIDKSNPDIGRLKLIEHHFVKSEGVKALIGISVNDPYTSEPLGIFYLDYRQPHDFSDLEVHHAKSLASLAAVAISNYRRLDENRQRRLLKAGFEISETIGVELNLEEILPKVLEKLRFLFHNTALCILLHNEDDHSLKFAPTTLKFYKIENPEFKDTHHFPLYKKDSGSIACKVARKAILSHEQENIYAPNVKNDPDYLPLNPKTTSELCISLMSGTGNLLGVLALERTASTFDEDDIELVETVAHQLGLAIERAKQSEELAFKSTVATMTAWASDIAHDINNEVGRIRGNAYLIKQTNSGNTKITEYADEIDESAKNLSSVGPWSSQAKKEIPLDTALKSYLEQIVTQRNVRLELSLQSPDIHIMMNPNEFQRVLRHLVRNAARAMEQSKNTIEKKIFVCTNLLQDGKVEILFQDFGPGINEKIRSTIFQRRTSTKLNSGGYGLLMARQLVDDMGGKISLLPAETGKGATFSIKLPVANKSHNVE